MLDAERRAVRVCHGPQRRNRVNNALLRWHGVVYPVDVYEANSWSQVAPVSGERSPDQHALHLNVKRPPARVAAIFRGVRFLHVISSFVDVLTKRGIVQDRDTACRPPHPHAASEVTPPLRACGEPNGRTVVHRMLVPRRAPRHRPPHLSAAPAVDDRTLPVCRPPPRDIRRRLRGALRSHLRPLEANRPHHRRRLLGLWPLRKWLRTPAL